VILDGSPVTWDKSVLNGTDLSDNFFNNRFADVTNLVETTLNAAPAGIGSIPVVEVNTTSLEGVAFAVIFSDPSLPITETRTAQIYFGGQDVAGDTFTINLAQPIDLADPERKLELGLGISFGIQGQFGAAPLQESIVRVNGNLVSSAAGGEDDGNGDTSNGGGNGALITVGGIGDSPANPPDPTASNTGYASDDELYDLLPFYSPGSTMVTVFTMDTNGGDGGGDDNIFWATVCTSAPSGYTEGITLNPPAAVNVENDDHTVTATVTNNSGDAIVGTAVTFDVMNGPNTGDMAMVLTDGAGQASFTYTGDGGPGDDVIRASFVDFAGATQSATAGKTWQEQCVVVFGNGLGLTTFTPGNHTWVTQVGQIQAFDPVLLISNGRVSIPLPQTVDKPYTGPGHLRRGPSRQGPELIQAFTAQVLLWSPQTFPNNPEQYSNGLLVRVYSDGSVLGYPYGASDNMRVWAKGTVVDGVPGVDRHVEISFPFEIQGF